MHSTASSLGRLIHFKCLSSQPAASSAALGLQQELSTLIISQVQPLIGLSLQIFPILVPKPQCSPLLLPFSFVFCQKMGKKLARTLAHS